MVNLVFQYLNVIVNLKDEIISYAPARRPSTQQREPSFAVPIKK